MSEYQENALKVLSVSSSSENRDSTESSAARGSVEEFYEEIEAPKFVDFTVPDNYRPDDRYWFCSRVGCDRKHEEEMDSEEIYKNFVLRVMAARSPNIRLKKALDRNASRTPRKCPLSAPPKPSKTRLSKMVITSSISEKLVNGGKKKVIRPLLKQSSTPLTKTKPVAAKYLTTPRNKKCADNQSSFRSVGITKTNTVEVSKSRTVVAKTLNFNHSPEKVKNIETCNDLRTPITKLCEGMSKLEISAQRKVALANSGKLCKKGAIINNTSKRHKPSSKKSKGKPEEPLKSERTTECSKVSEKFSKGNKPKLLGDNFIDSSKNAAEELRAKQVAEECDECQESKPEESYSSSVVPVLSINGTDLASARNTSSEGNSSKSKDSTNEENNNKNPVDENNISEAETDQHECVESDDKENDAASDQNRILDKNSIQNGTKPFGKLEKRSQLKKVAAQAKEKNTKEGLISSSPAIKPNKPKTKITNPKPFRLRTDERGILKEANLDKRTDHVALETDGSNLSSPGKKTLEQLEDAIQRGNDILCSKRVPIGQQKSKLVPRCNEGRNERKSTNSPAQNNAMKRLEKFRKTTTSSPLSKKSNSKHQRIEKTTINEDMMMSFLVPGERLEVIHETASPDVSELKSTSGKDGQQQEASRSSSRRKKSVTVSNDRNFRRIPVPQSCTKKVK